MTIKIRNRLMRVFFLFSLVCCAVLVASVIVALVTNAIVPPSENTLPPVQTKIHQALRALPFMRYHFTATMIAIGVLTLYVPATLFLMIEFFENTQSSEIIFFMGVLIGMLCEGVRLLIPLFGLGLSFSQLLLFAGRVLSIGRFAVPLSFFCLAVFSEAHQRQDVERNLTICIALSVVLATGLPLNTAQISTTCAIPTGFAPVVAFIRFLIFALAVLSLWLNARSHDIPELKRMTQYAAVLIAGYALLLLADNFVLLGLGTAALTVGTLQFLRNLHRLYKWK